VNGRCWADILPLHVIERWLEADLWDRRHAEIDRARALL
jgi:hypothetical protein